MPEVSVIMPVYNGEKFLAEAIESVLNQTYHDLELIVVNDGSTDRSQEIIESYSDPRVRNIIQTNKGLPIARNAGIEASNGKLITFLDCDDVYLPDSVMRRIKYFEENTRCRFLYADSVLINENGRTLAKSTWQFQRVEPISGKCFRELFLKGTFLNTCSVMMRREILDQVGTFDRTFRHALDYDLWLRIAYHYSFDVLKVPVVKYRRHSSNMSNRTANEDLYSALALLKAVKTLPDLDKVVGKREIRNRLYSQCFDVAYNYLRQGDAKAARYWLRKAWYWGRKPKTLVQLIATWCGPLMRRYQARKGAE